MLHDPSDEERTATHKVLVAVIDASESHRRQVELALVSFYQVATFSNSNEAIAALHKTMPCAVLVDNTAPPLGGFNCIRTLRSDWAFADVSVIFTSSADDDDLRAAAKECGADAFLAKPYRRSALIRSISQQVNKAVERKWETLPSLQRTALVGTMEVFNSISDVIEKGEPITYAKVTEACGPLVEAVGMREYKEILAGVRDHDNYSYAHSLGVATLLLLFGYTIGLKGAELPLLGTGGLLHDVGKMLIPYEVLNKPGSLTDEEFKVMKGHVPLTLQYLGRCPDLPRNVSLIAAHHHERLNGSGYPAGLKAGALNELARMAAIVDVFCALSERRVYRGPVDAEHALAIMTGEMGATLDQKLLILFREMLLDSAR
jgi:HD-GYP domain-containing protein (c-di-GMP phosphodiesterase class II)